MRTAIAAPSSILLFLAFAGHPLLAGAPDFEREIAPLLAQHCVRCHNDTDSKGSVDLSLRVGALGNADLVSVLEAGNADASLLMDVISGDKPRMPKSGGALTQAQQQLLRDWIDAGAEWPDDFKIVYDPTNWWSLRPLSPHVVPSLKDSSFIVRNPIDAFVAEAWTKRGLHGSPEADRRTLLRRVYFDLIGLAPNPEEVDRFVNDPDPLAYEAVVDRLLESPRYGERWARHWLDAVHYGDTHGYDKDKLRSNAWPYRDYVIRSFNEDKPYSQFIREQIAGDHFEPDTRDGIEALGLIAAGPFDFVGQIEVGEGTVEKQRVRNIDRDDMVSTVMNTFISMTAQCARCHDHKFDPISQQDYYSLQSVFAAVDRADRRYDADPEVACKRRSLNLERATLQQQLDALQSEIGALGGEKLAACDESLRAARSAVSNERPAEYGYHSAISDHAHDTKWVQVDLGAIRTLKRVAIAGTHDDFGGIGAGFGFPVRFRIESSLDAEFTRNVQLLASHEESDFPNPGTDPVSFDVQSNPARYVRVTASKLAPRTNDYIFALAELLVVDDQDKEIGQGAAVVALDSIEAPVRWRATNLVDGLYPGKQPKELESKIRSLEREHSRLEMELVGSEKLKVRDGLRIDLQRVDAALAALPSEQSVFAAATDFNGSGSFQPTKGKPRPIHVLARGAETEPREEVNAAALRCVQGLSGDLGVAQEQDESAGRAALANWIADRNNHLTWRSIVNRMWHYHFGRGLVESLNDFGRMGAEPTHPELLDWLAIEFRDGKQSIKDLHRWIVTSSTYRQSSGENAANARIDAGNQFLWRMNRRRLEAEAIRDSVLQTSGKLRLEMGGPGFPLFGLIDDHSPHYLYDQFNADDPATHRRAVYRFIVRSVPDPWMTTLDCADASVLTDRRNETLTALQALAMLNNRFMLRMSEHFAERIQSQTTDSATQIALAFQMALQREPSDNELETMSKLASEIGFVNVCRTLFNLNEFVFLD